MLDVCLVCGSLHPGWTLTVAGCFTAWLILATLSFRCRPMVRRTACTCRPSSACSTGVRCRRKGPHHRIVGRPARSHRGWGFATRRRNGAAGPPGGRQPRPTPSCAGPRAIRIRNGRRRQSSCTGGPSASHSCPRTRGTYRRCGGGDKPRIATPVCTAPLQCRSFQGRASDTCEYPLRTMRDATMPYDGLYACVRHPRPVPLATSTHSIQRLAC